MHELLTQLSKSKKTVQKEHMYIAGYVTSCQCYLPAQNLHPTNSFSNRTHGQDRGEQDKTNIHALTECGVLWVNY